MGCGHYFVVDRLEVLVDEGDSRSSSRAHEHENFRLVSQLNVAIQILWSRCPLSWAAWTNQLVVQSQRVSSFYHDLHLRFCLCLCHSPIVQQTNWYSCSHERNVYRIPEHSNGTFVLSQRVSPFYHDLDLDLVGLVDWLLLVEQLLNPILSSNHVSRKSSGAPEVIHVLFRMWFLRFHHNNFRGTISWECVVKDDGVRSCLIELKSFLLSKLYIDPIHRVLMFHPCCMLCMYCARRGAFKSISYGSLCSLFIGFTEEKNTVCLSLLKLCPPGINPEFVMECTLTAHPMW